MLLMELGMAIKAFVLLGGVVKSADATLAFYSPWRGLEKATIYRWRTSTFNVPSPRLVPGLAPD